MVDQTLYHQCISGTVPASPLVMEMQTGSTNNHIYDIFFLFVAPMLAAPVLMMHYKGDCHVSSTSPNRQVND